MQFDTSKLFSGKNGIETTVKLMDYPFLITYAFDKRKKGTYVPDSLRVVLVKCCELAANEAAKPEHLKDMLMRGLKADASESGLLGLDALPLDELFSGRAYVTMVVGVTGTKIRLRRYGDCLGIRPVNDRDELHEKAAAILARLADDGQGYVRHFIQRYSFALDPDLRKTGTAYVLDVYQELMTMERYLPDIKWLSSKRLTADLGADFTGERQGVKIGVYGDASVFARIVYEQEVDDQDWRLGKVRSTTTTELVFGVGAGSRPRIEYFVQTADLDRSWDPAPIDIDYQREQGLNRDVARMIYAGLYQRGFQSIVRSGNEHWIRFRQEPESAVV